MRQAITDEPVALAGTSSGTEYTVQNLAGIRCRIAVKADASGALASHYFIEPFEHGYPTPDSGQSIYVWNDLGEGEVNYEET